MPTIEIRFPAGRYHATPIGSHVNEGHIEWPPSPWRLLRSLIAVGFNTQGWSELPETAKRLFEKLASHPPRFRLPSVSMAHSRHYMPIGGLDGSGREKTTLVFDTWANVGSKRLVVFWDCELTEDERGLLSNLVDSLGYLGRSESWVEAAIIDDRDAQPNTFLFDPKDHPGPGWEQVHVLGPISPNQYATWYQQKTEALLSKLPTLDGTLRPSSKAYKDIVKAREKAIEPYPRDLIDCLTKDTSWWKDRHWASPPGSQPLLYWRPARHMVVSPPRERQIDKTRLVTSMLLAIATPNGSRGLLPRIERTVAQAELLHRQLVGIVTKTSGSNCPVLTGCDDERKPLRLKHEHAHILPLDLDGDHHLDHFLIYAAMGLGAEAQRAVRLVRQTFMKGNRDGLRLAVAGVGTPHELLHPSEAKLLVNCGTSWVSVTPFVPPRFLKKTGKNSLEGQVQAELESRHLPPATCIELLRDKMKGMRHFVRRRTNGQPPPVEFGFALKLSFEKPLQISELPLCLGYASHFGMGLFRLEQDEAQLCS